MKTLKSKFIFWICILFTLMGFLIFIPLSIILPKRISSQILKRDVEITRYLAREVQGPLLINNKLVLQLLLEDRLHDLEDILYIFIRGRDGRIISSTFKKGFPKGLLDINLNIPPDGIYGEKNKDKNMYGIQQFTTKGKNVYDIAIPLLKGELGSLHLGVSLESSKTEIAEFTKIKYYVAIVIVIGLGVGILIFACLGIFLSNRIARLKNFADEIGKGNLNKIIDIHTKDELGSLAASFNTMVRELKEKIETIKKLSYLEERDRIAIELHDGLAQNLADIIKRLELCERLFNMNPERAFEELATLKKNTREVLDKTRRAIFDLKSPHDEDFNLLDTLRHYIRNYQRRSDIKITLNMSDTIRTVLPDTSKSIFCIIREALTNIQKHSQAKNVEVHLKNDDNDYLIIMIKDDGIGFDMNKAELSTSRYGSWGLTSMRKRTISLGGTIVVKSAPGKGTEIDVTIPLKTNKVDVYEKI